MTEEEKTELKIAELSSYQVFGDTIQAIAKWHLSEIKKAELQTLIIVRDIPGRELYLLDRITELQSELRKLEEGQ